MTTLAERFLAAGYRTAGFVSSYVLHARWGIAQGHETYDDPFDYAGLESRALTDVERPAGPVVDAALAWLRQPRRADRPFYLWVHLYDPHDPYEPPEEYRRKAPTPYAGEVMYADAQVGRLLDALDTLGLRRNDRGRLPFRPRRVARRARRADPRHLPLRRLARRAADHRAAAGAPSARPLSARPARPGPRAPGGRDADRPRPRRAAGAVGARRREPAADGGARGSGRNRIGAPPTADAPDALAGPVSYAETFYPRFHYNWSELRVETARWKSCARRGPSSTTSSRIRRSSRRLGRAPGGRRHPLEAPRLDEPADEGAEPAPAKLDPDAQARLQALGYVSGAESGSRRRTGPRPDPKDGLPFLDELLRAQTMRDAGRLDEAAGAPRSARAEGPGQPGGVRDALHGLRPAQGPDGAIAAARAPVGSIPESVVAVLDLAMAFRGAGRADEATTGFERVLALEPGNLKALLNLGEIHAPGASGKRRWTCTSAPSRSRLGRRARRSASEASRSR